MSANLTGVRAKIDRCEFHINEFKDTLRNVWAPTAYTTEVTKVEEQPNGERITYSITNTVPPPLCGIQIGEAIHSLRSALDHLMCQLAVAAGNPAACDKTQFPIFTEDTTDHRKRMKRWIRHVAPEAQAAIQELQPYQRRPTDPVSDPLWMLSELDNIDKHRLLIVIDPKFADAMVHMRVNDDVQSRRLSEVIPDWSPLKHGTVFFRLTRRGPARPDAKLEVKAETNIGVVFAQTGLKCDGSNVFDVIRSIQTDVTSIVNDFESSFF